MANGTPNSPTLPSQDELATMLQSFIAGPQVPPLIARPDATTAPTPAPAPSPMPATSPMTQAGLLSQLPAVAQQFSEEPFYKAPTEASTAIAQKIDAISREQGSMPLPQTAPRNKILAALLNITGPGRAINQAIYGPGELAYSERQKQLAAQLASLKDEAQIPLEQQRSASGITGIAGRTLYQGGELQNQADRIAAYTKYTSAMIPIRQGLLQIAQGNLTERQRHDKVAEYLTSQGIQVQRDRNGVILKIGMGNQQIRADEFNAAVANKNQGLIDQALQAVGLKSFFGIDSPISGVTTVQPVVAGSDQPVSKTPQSGGRRKNAPLGSKDNPIVVK